MKTRAHRYLTIVASALTMLAPAITNGAEQKAQVDAQKPSQPEKKDTLMNSATKSLIESVGELSRTAAKLSDTALKLLEAQENLNSQKPAQKQSNSKTESKPAQKNANESSLEEIAKEIADISSEIAGSSQSESPKQTEILQTAAAEEKVIPGENGEETVETEVITTQLSAPSPEFTLENREGGQFLWIPDENLPLVEAVLSGENVPAGELKTMVDLNEKTYWRGDSILMAIPTKRLGRFDRKLYNWLIYPKGLWHFGLSANYGELNTDDSEFLSLIQDVDLKGKIYSIKPSVSYFIRNNVCVGMRLAFTKGEMGINSFKVDIDEDMSFNLHDIKYSSDSYAAAVFIQQYFGITRRGRFAVFNEAELSVGTGNTHFIRPFDGTLRDTRTKTQSFNINYSPGVSVMIMKNAAFNLSFGVFGFHLKNEKQWENGEESGNRLTSGINFRFNIFNINFGVAIII